MPVTFQDRHGRPVSEARVRAALDRGDTTLVDRVAAKVGAPAGSDAATVLAALDTKLAAPPAPVHKAPAAMTDDALYAELFGKPE